MATLNNGDSGAVARGIINAKWDSLVPVSVKSSSYTASASDLIPVDASSASVPITLPTAPADKTTIAVKLINVSGSFTSTITTGGSDVYNKSGGSTTFTLSLLNQGVILQYKASTAIWYVIADNLSLAQLDVRFLLVANSATALTDAASIAITANKHTLSTSRTTITFTDTFAGDFVNIEVTMSSNTAAWTFPTGSLCTFNGITSGSNVMNVSATVGDTIVLSRWKNGSSYAWIGINIKDNNSSNSKIPTIGIAASDEVTALVTGTGKVTFRMPYAMTLTAVRASLSTPQTSGSLLTVDIKESGSSILSTKLIFDNGEKTTVTAVTQPVLSDSFLADDAEITVDVTQIGDGTAKGLKIWLIGT
jgi:hypothetical protein